YASDQWAGSAALTSDYFVRGISRTSNHPALQLDFHYSNPNGFLAGVFASNTQIDPGEPRDAELSAFLGYAWSLNDAWRARILASHYAYPWNRAGSHYNYDELDLDVSYEGWLHFGVGYSPDSPRFLGQPYRRLIGVTEKSAEISAQRQIVGRFSLTAGVGYSFLDGPESGGYGYWSGGAAYDFRAVTVALSYVNTSAEAKALFYNAAASGQWTGSVIWRF
ncbi:MAG TPA: TorF family putative porin, partial [Steroidobacteraceae bacterium]|nr:TorF family putative porin [Steroidobacteraceae bacterium]